MDAGQPLTFSREQLRELETEFRQNLYLDVVDQGAKLEELAEELRLSVEEARAWFEARRVEHYGTDRNLFEREAISWNHKFLGCFNSNEKLNLKFKISFPSAAEKNIEYDGSYLSGRFCGACLNDDFLTDNV